jgi:hypothetical protein
MGKVVLRSEMMSVVVCGRGRVNVYLHTRGMAQIAKKSSVETVLLWVMLMLCCGVGGK